MRNVVVVFVLASVAACAHAATPVEAPVEAAPVASVAATASEPPPPPDPPRPAQPEGTTLLHDQFLALVKDKGITDRAIPYATRIDRAATALGGVKGVPFDDDPIFKGTAWFGINQRSLIAPMGCSVLILVDRGSPSWQIESTDHVHCGLPYAADPMQMYRGPVARHSAFNLEETLKVVGPLTPLSATAKAQALLLHPDYVANGEQVWTGLAGRKKTEAGEVVPISCKGLFVGVQAARIEDVPLERCNLAWPIPGASFDPGPPIKLVDKAPALNECASTCAANEMCVLDQRSPYTSRVQIYPGGLRASYPDGKAAELTLTASCTPIPSTCANAILPCFFGPPGSANYTGPCPKDDYEGSALNQQPSPHIMCFTRFGRPKTSAPPPSPLVPTPSKSRQVPILY